MAPRSTRWVIALASALSLPVVAGAAVLYWRTGAATATFLLIAWGIVCGLGAAPVVFSVITRRRAVEYNRRLDEAATLRGGSDADGDHSAGNGNTTRS